MSDRSKLKVALLIGGGREVHATNADGNYATLCGVSDDDDPEHCGTHVPLKRGDKIDCLTCFNIILHSKQYRTCDFNVHPKGPKTNDR